MEGAFTLDVFTLDVFKMRDDQPYKDEPAWLTLLTYA